MVRRIWHVGLKRDGGNFLSGGKKNFHGSLILQEQRLKKRQKKKGENWETACVLMKEGDLTPSRIDGRSAADGWGP